MLRVLRYALGGLVCAGIWLAGVVLYTEGATVIGPALWLLGGLMGIVLVGLYQRNADATAEGLIEAIASFFGRS